MLGIRTPGWYTVSMVLMLMSVAVLLVWIVVDRERLDRRKQRACQPFVALGMVEYDGRHFFVCDSVDGPIVKEDK